MAMVSLADLSAFINRQIEVQTELEAYLWGLEALVAVSLRTNNFYDLSKTILHHYFSVVADLIKEVIRINQTNLDDLLKQEK